MKSKYLALGLSVVLALSLVSCGGQQAQEPQEPTQEVQQAESISAQPVVAPEEVKQEIVTTASETEPEELSGEVLTHYFQLAYDGSKPYVGELSTEEAIAWELEVLGIRAENENKGLPADYADQYRAWRPVEEAPESTAQQVSEAPKNQDQGSNQQQQQNQSQSQQNQSTTQQTKPSTQTQPTTPQPSGGKAMYGGFNTYDEYIQDLHRQFPEYSIERIKELNPDQAQMYVGHEAITDAQDGRLSGS